MVLYGFRVWAAGFRGRVRALGFHGVGLQDFRVWVLSARDLGRRIFGFREDRN